MTLSSEEEVEERDLKEEDFDIMGRNEEREWEIEIVEARETTKTGRETEGIGSRRTFNRTGL